MACTIGVDFGTSTTEIAVYRDGRTQLASAWDGAVVIPSIVAFLPNGAVEVGVPAKKRVGIDPKNTLHSVKRIIGLPWRVEGVQKFKATYQYDMEEGPGGTPLFITRAGKKSAADVAQTLLETMRAYPLFEAIKPDKVAVTVPAAFSPRQRNEIVATTQRAGFANVTVIDEPYAAALPYISDGNAERFVVVFDLGGGTFDFALLRLQGATHWVLATGGEQYLGGNDIDLRLSEWVAQEVLRAHRQDLRTNVTVFHRLLLAAEEAKVALTTVTETTVDLGQVDPSLVGKKLSIRRSHLERLCEDLVRRTFVACDEVLARAKVSPRQVTDIDLVGGTSRMPVVRQALSEYFGRKALDDVEPDQVVAIGAAMAAAVLAGDRDVLR